jgi:hypothetical protein
LKSGAVKIVAQVFNLLYRRFSNRQNVAMFSVGSLATTRSIKSRYTAGLKPALRGRQAKTKEDKMIYLWAIPILIAITLLIWGFWASVTKRRGPGE